MESSNRSESAEDHASDSTYVSGRSMMCTVSPEKQIFSPFGGQPFQANTARTPEAVYNLFKGLLIMHLNGVYHFDIKGDNALITSGPDGRARWIDFGNSVNINNPASVKQLRGRTMLEQRRVISTSYVDIVGWISPHVNPLMWIVVDHIHQLLYFQKNDGSETTDITDRDIRFRSGRYPIVSREANVPPLNARDLQVRVASHAFKAGVPNNANLATDYNKLFGLYRDLGNDPDGAKFRTLLARADLAAFGLMLSELNGPYKTGIGPILAKMSDPYQPMSVMEALNAYRGVHTSAFIARDVPLKPPCGVAEL